MAGWQTFPLARHSNLRTFLRCVQIEFSSETCVKSTGTESEARVFCKYWLLDKAQNPLMLRTMANNGNGLAAWVGTKFFRAGGKQDRKGKIPSLSEWRKAKVSWRIFKWFKRVLSYFPCGSHLVGSQGSRNPLSYGHKMGAAAGCGWRFVCIQKKHRKPRARHFKCLLKQ